ncbi:MAG: hypothetical protein HC831_29405 [Chloroflexia bacterium]|nr:hypothetical protein [Chloroflexia bacterium]
MSQKCKSCGAPLEFQPESEQVKCSYCGTINRYHGINLGKLFHDFFAYKPQAIRPKQNIRATRFWIIFGLGLPIIILLFQFTTIFGNLSWTSECQFIDCNNDGVLDVVGFGRTSARWEILTIVDGETGSILGKKDVREPGVLKTIYCIDEKHLITVDSNHELVFYEPKDLSTRFTFDLPGSINGYYLNGNILCLKLKDFSEEIILAINIETGAEVSCENKKDFEPPKTSNYSEYYTDNETGIKYETNYAYETKTTVSAIGNNKIMWIKKLNDLKLSKPKSFQYTPNHIIIFGEKKNDKGTTYITGLNSKTGNIEYETKVKSSPNILLNSYYNNKYLITYWNTKLIAYDIKTGEEVWEF